MLKVNIKDTRTYLNIFHTCSSVSIVNFEQVNNRWELVLLRTLQPRS